MRALKHFRVDFIVGAIVLFIAFLYDSWAGVGLTAILIVVEIVFSFDNAAVNAKYLERLNPFWQRIFLTVGVLIAVFGMRLIFPFVIVCVSGSINPVQALQLALAKGDPHTPGTYGYILNQAHPAIAAFGGMFLLLLFLDFVFDGDREELWLKSIERPLQRIGKLNVLPVIIAGLALLATAELLVDEVHIRSNVLFAGLLGIVLYLTVNGLSTMMEHREEAMDREFEDEDAQGSFVQLAGKAALSMFLFLEVLDATFSFDGVIGAFAITPDPLIIMLGLGVGALCVRSMTVYLVRQGTLGEYRYLEAGAHWAIGALAIMLLLTIKFELGEFLVGGIGIGFITASYLSSLAANKKDAAVAAARESHPRNPNEDIVTR